MKESALRLYKYISLDSDDRIRWACEMFTESKIYFPIAPQFNDPFDCKFDISMDADDERWREYIANSRKKQGLPEVSLCELDLLTSDIRSTKVFSDEDIKQAVEVTKNRVRILSLTTSCDNILMWSHYTHYHQGMCIEFSFPSGRMFDECALVKVDYNGPFPTLNFFDMLNGTAGDNWLRTKHRNWAYEDEYRILGPPSEAGIFTLPEKSITGVILGSNISEKNRTKALSWVKLLGYPIGKYVAREQPDKYALDIVPIEKVP